MRLGSLRAVRLNRPLEPLFTIFTQTLSCDICTNAEGEFIIGASYCQLRKTPEPKLTIFNGASSESTLAMDV